MQKRLLGKTGIKVSEIGFGAWGIGGYSNVWGYGTTNDTTSECAIRTALEMGCNFFDTADCYGEGRSEIILGSVLSNNRSDVIIATKAGINFYNGLLNQNFDPLYIRFAINQSLLRLKTNYIDVFLLHNPSRETLLNEPLVLELIRLKEKGAIRSIGISSPDINTAIFATRLKWPEVIEVAYNMLATEADNYFFSIAHGKQIGIIVREPLANGFLTGKFNNRLISFPYGDIRYLWPKSLIIKILKEVEDLKAYCRQGESLAQLALRFVIESHEISSVVCGCKTPSQVKENLVVSDEVSLLYNH